MQNHLIFQPVFKYFTTPAGDAKISAWKPKGLPEEKSKPPNISNDSLPPKLTFINNAEIGGTFEGSCLRRGKVFF